MSVSVRQAAAERAARPEGWRYQADFLSAAEEAELLQLIAKLPLQAARYREWTARRRIVSYGGRYDFSHHRLDPAQPIPPALEPLRERVAAWGELDPAQLTHAAVAEYRSGTQLGWHRDVPEFQVVLGVSLAGRARMRFRPYPHHKGSRTLFAIDLEPRSIYLMRGPVRWRWQHAISATHELRYSITFRTRRAPSA
jgi:alkylated DNA repair dioxygenase AlkB